MINIAKNLPKELEGIEIGFAENIHSYVDRIVVPILDGVKASMSKNENIVRYRFQKDNGRGSVISFCKENTDEQICVVDYNSKHHPTLYI